MNACLLHRLLRENPVVVTGTGSFSAAGDSVQALWERAVSGKGTAVRRLVAGGADQECFAVCNAPEINRAAAEFRPIRGMDRSMQMAWAAAEQALNQAQLADACPPNRNGVMAGSSRGPLGKISEALGIIGHRRMPAPLAAESTLASLSGALSQLLDLRGPGATVSATCASAAVAISLAAEQILLGKADAMLAGGAEAPLHPMVLRQLQSAGLLGSHEEAHRACRPFDVTRDGLVPGEGAAFLVLESARAAEARGAKPLARLAGWSSGIDASGRAGLNEQGTGLIEMMSEAIQAAGLSADGVGLINTHGTGTKLNDRIESRVIGKLFAGRSTPLPCISTKPVTGHCLGATPALEAVICIEALRRKTIPPTSTCANPDPDCAILLPMEPAPAPELAAVLSNSIGFWGYHACLLFSKP